MLKVNYRSSRPELFCKKVSLKNFAKFTGKPICQILFFYCLRPATFLKKTLVQKFSSKFCKILKNTFFYRTPLVAASKTKKLLK